MKPWPDFLHRNGSFCLVCEECSYSGGLNQGTAQNCREAAFSKLLVRDMRRIVGSAFAAMRDAGEYTAGLDANPLIRILNPNYQ